MMDPNVCIADVGGMAAAFGTQVDATRRRCAIVNAGGRQELFGSTKQKLWKLL